MRYFFGCLALLLAYSACTSTETVQEPEEIEQEATQSMVPSWYSDGVHFSSDSLALHGYSLASAMDSSRAVELSTQNSLKYLRFQIDRTTEQARKNLADSLGTETYSSPAFIIKLRNTVSQLSLNSATFTQEHLISDEGIHFTYIRSTISRSELYNLLENRIQDDSLLEELRNSSH